MTKIRTFTLMAVSAVALAACDTTAGRFDNSGASNNPDPNQRTKQGALIGGLVGAATGALTAGDDADERRRGAVIGAAIGAGGGAIIGNQLDKQAAELRQQVGNDVQIVNTGNELILTMPQDILFAVDSATLRPDLQSDLRALATNLNNYPNSTVDIIGHTDSDGDASYNLRLSERRAQSVRNVLINSGVDGFRLRAIGMGEDDPVTDNFSEASKAQNRRVEIIIRPNA
ncbi:MAG: OmpA family protein [Pseudomonadota bacterium]